MKHLLRVLALVGTAIVAYLSYFYALRLVFVQARCGIFLVCLTAAGCASAPRVPERVEVPVQVPCRVQIPAEPVWATKSLAEDASIWDQAKALLAERKQRQAHQAKLEAAAKACQ